MTAIPTSRISSRRFIGLVVGSVLTAGLAAVAVAQQPAPAPDKAARQQELDALQAEQRKAADAEAMLKSEIATLGEDRRKLNEALLTTAGRLRLAENNIAATETRLKKLEDKERTVRKSLEGRRAVITEILAALERIGRRPPPAIMTSPDDALLTVRTATLLGAVLPEMRGEADALAADLVELARVRGEMKLEREALGRDVAAFSDDQQRMGLLVQERQKKQAEAEKALDAQRQRTVLLARQADNLKDLIAKLERDAAARQGGGVALELGDQIFEIVRLPGQEHRALTLGIERLFGLGLLFLPFLDQEGHALLVGGKCGHITAERLPFDPHIGTHPGEFQEVGRKRVGFAAHFRQYGAQQHGGAHGKQRVVRRRHDGGRRPAADALERRQDLRDDGAAALERFAHRALFVFELLQSRFGGGDVVLGEPQPAGGGEQRLVELAPIFPERRNLALEHRLRVGGLALLRLQRVEFLLARGLVGRGGRLLRHGDRREPRRQDRPDHKADESARGDAARRDGGHVTRYARAPLKGD